MKITVRKLFDELYDTNGLKDDIHRAYGKELISALREESPIDTGRFQESWTQTRTDTEGSIIWNQSGVDEYLLGTGVFVGHSMWSHGSGGYQWKADGIHLRGPMTRGINPHKIARAIDENQLALCNSEASLGLRPWTDDSYKLNAYDFIKNMRSAIDKGLTLAVRRLQNGNNE